MPYIVRQCLEEIERRGMEEVGIYRVSGVATDIQNLKAAFDTSESDALFLSPFIGHVIKQPGKRRFASPLFFLHDFVFLQQTTRTCL